MSLKSGHQIIPVHGKEQDEQIRDFRAYSVGTIRLQPDGWFFTSPFINFADKLYDFKFKPSDTLVMTYPKCGTTWTQEIIWTMKNNPDLNHPMADVSINTRSPFLDSDFLLHGYKMPRLEPGHPIYEGFAKFCPGKKVEDGIFLQIAEACPDPRTIKTHLPFSLLAKDLLNNCKVVYVIRNPLDVVTSYHHHSRLLKPHGYVGTLDSFVDHFVNDKLIYGPFWTHAKEAWDKREHPNLHFVFYEDMKANPKREIMKLQKFLGTNLTDKQIDNVVEYTSFSAMKKRDSVMEGSSSSDNPEHSFVVTEVQDKDGGFFRKGVSGDWKNKLSEEQANRVSEWTNKNVQKHFGPQFKYSNLEDKNI